MHWSPKKPWLTYSTLYIDVYKIQTDQLKLQKYIHIKTTYMLDFHGWLFIVLHCKSNGMDTTHSVPLEKQILKSYHPGLVALLQLKV